MNTWIVENSQAPQAIGDTVAAFPALHARAWEEPLEVYLSSAPCRELLSHPQITQLSEKPLEAHVLDVQELFPVYAHSGLSLPAAYMMAMGREVLARSGKPPEIILNVGLNEEPQEKFDFLLAPFSHSDNGTDTKLWPQENWYAVLSLLGKYNKKVGILGTSRDAEHWALGKEGLVLDKPLPEVCRMVRHAKATICVDNGIHWLCQGMMANEIVFLPQTQHPNWTGSPYPNAVNLTVKSTFNELAAALQYLGKR